MEELRQGFQDMANETRIKNMRGIDENTKALSEIEKTRKEMEKSFLNEGNTNMPHGPLEIRKEIELYMKEEENRRNREQNVILFNVDESEGNTDLIINKWIK